MKTVNLFFLMLLVASCGDNEKTKISKYYDLEGYFKNEAKRLQSGGYNLQKKFVEGLYVETVTSTSADWSKVLSPFTSCDINKLSWVNSYAADSTVEGDSLKLVYSAMEEKLPVRRIELLFYKQEPVKIIMEKGKENFYYSSAETYVYYPDHFYIRSMQKVRLMDEQQYEITGKFVR